MQLDLKRKETVVMVLVIAAVVFGAGYKMAGYYLDSPYEKVLSDLAVKTEVHSNQESVAEAQENQAAEAEDEKVFVHIVGAVNKPGLYSLPTGARIADAVNLAGASPEADFDQVNLAELVYDQQKIVVPKRGEAPPPTEVYQSPTYTPAKPAPAVKSTSSSGVVNGKVNINRASAAELETLPGIGPALAARIIDYRNSHGGFKDIQELKKVSGIGDQRFANLKERITI